VRACMHADLDMLLQVCTGGAVGSVQLLQHVAVLVRRMFDSRLWHTFMRCWSRLACCMVLPCQFAMLACSGGCAWCSRRGL
jgi:hypothetical protein